MLHIPARALVAETLLRVFTFDSRAWQTLTILIRRPGLLATQYLEGKRALYVASLRLYLFISFVTILLLAVIPDPEDAQLEIGSADSTVTETPALESIDSSQLLFQTSDEYPQLVEFIRPTIEDPHRMVDTFLSGCLGSSSL